MILTLEVVGEQAERLGPNRRKVFSGIGGTIGRLADNDWVFADPYVSGRHALIRYRNGKYFVEDTSTNGVFINAPDRRLTRGQAQQLKHGDVLYIDAYRISVRIEGDAAGAQLDDPLARLEHRLGRAAARPAEEDVPADRTESLDLHWPVLDSQAAPGTEWFGMSEVSDRSAGAVRHVPPQPLPSRPVPAPRAARAARPAVTKSQPGASSRPARTAAGASLWDVLLQAAGIEGLEPSSEVARRLGEMLRSAVGGLMEVLRARERIKDELRVRGTTFKAADNNPLKFSANVEDAFHNLLVKRNPAYLAPSAALEDAFRDVRDHQQAAIAAMRLAFEATLAQFDPGRLQEEFDRQMRKGSLLGVPAKLRYWELFREKYQDLLKDNSAAFRALFSEAFAKAYEEQLDRLKSASPSREQ